VRRAYATSPACGKRSCANTPVAKVKNTHAVVAISHASIVMPFLLGSWYGLLFVPLYIGGIAPRAMAEERLLARELPGYADYMKRVRRRIIPGVW